jgi:hypothetical protein
MRKSEIDWNKKPLRLQPSYALVYAALLPRLQEIAREHGYALTVHGSMATDMDLVAAPWVEDASDPEVLVRAIATVVGCDMNQPGLPNPGKKPHGRLVWTLLFDVLEYGGFGLSGPYIDLSVMPRKKARRPKTA